MLLFAKIAIALAAMIWSATAVWAQPPLAFMRYYQVPATSTHPGVTVPVLLLSTLSPKPAVGVMLFAGGLGKINFNSAGQPAPASTPGSLINNFLVRNRILFAEKGVAVAVVDWGPAGVTEEQRLSQGHADIISKLIDFVRNEPMYQVSRVWLVGTSSGTLSVLNMAARYPLLPFNSDQPNPNTGRPDGIVLTSTETVHYDSGSPNLTSCSKSIDDVTAPAPSAINVPAVVIWNVNDKCGCSPGSPTGGPSGSNVAAAVVTKLGHRIGGPKRVGKSFSSTPTTNLDQCQALTPHGFKGVDNNVVSYIVNSLVPPPPPFPPPRPPTTSNSPW